MSRYRTYGPRDDTPLTDGDTRFDGFVSRIHPAALNPGELAYSKNGRCNRGAWTPRKGAKSLSTDISLTNPPLVVDVFTLGADSPIASITRVSTTATVTTATPHGRTTGDFVNIQGADQTEYNGDFIITVTGSSTFTYTVSGTPTTPATGTIVFNFGPRIFDDYDSSVVGVGQYANTQTNEEGVLIASSGKAYLYRYGRPTATIAYPAGETCDAAIPVDVVQFLSNIYIFRGYGDTATKAVTSLTRSSTTATVTTTSDHSLSTGDWVTIDGATPVGYNGLYKVTVTGLNTFTYTVPNTLTTPATGTITVRKSKPALVWDMNLSTATFAVAATGAHPLGSNFIRIPAVDWAVHFKSRGVIPYSRDQLLFSDLLDPNTWDKSQNQFRLLPGTADWLVAAMPYQEAKLLVLYRKSVHVLILDGSDLSIASHFEITRSFGCVARRTAINCGPFILWLSDIGIMRMNVTDELSLKNDTLPLSDGIQNVIDTINWNYADGSVGIYWDNRAYFAVPCNGATTNNTVLVYNFINNKWESVDEYPADFNILGFARLPYNGQQRVHAVTTNGFVFLTEEIDGYDETGTPGSFVAYPIDNYMMTRSYLSGTYGMKTVRRVQVEADMQLSTLYISETLHNPDKTTSERTYGFEAIGDASVNHSVNQRGNSVQLKIRSTGQRPSIKAVLAESRESSRSTINRK